MKKLLLSLVALFTATLTFAQATLVASLSHDGKVSMFYGTYALQNAMTAAVDGDVINLSGGSFQATDITKNVSIRGAGIESATPTYITGNFTLSITADAISPFQMEGLKITQVTVGELPAGSQFLKCTFSTITGSSGTKMPRTNFYSCRITSSLDLYGTSDVSLVSCYVYGFENQSSTTASALFANCVIEDKLGGYWDDNHSSDHVNCIFLHTNDGYHNSYLLPSTASATNCLCIGNEFFFNNISARSGCKTSTSNFNPFFKTYTGTYSDSETFELTDEAKAIYLGTDGSEMGMHGGILPYDATPSYPLISSMNVSAKTSGILNVDIEVSNPE